MCVKINVLYVHCTAYISHILYIRVLRNKPFIFLVIVYLPSKDHSKTAILKLCAYDVRGLARGLTFNIA